MITKVLSLLFIFTSILNNSNENISKNSINNDIIIFDNDTNTNNTNIYTRN